MSSSSTKRRARILPVEIWDYIISMIDGDRYLLQSLSLVSKHFLSISNRHHQTLKISDPISNFLPSLFRRFPNLNRLSFYNFSGDPAPVLLQIADFDFRLQSLDLSYHVILPVKALRRLLASILGGVKSLNISSLSSLVDDDLELIPKLFPNLEELDLSHVERNYGDDDGDDFDCSRGRSPQRRYDSRHKKGKKMTEDGISVLVSKLKCLRRINLQGNKGASDKVLISLSDNCPNLEEIVLEESYTNLTHAGIGSALRSCERLKKIIMHGNPYRKEWAMDHICEALCCAQSLSEIYFHHRLVSDANLYAMSKACLPLETFTLSNGTYGDVLSFTYAGVLSFLQTYDSLDYLALEGIKFLSDAKMATLAKYLAKARVVKLNSCGKLSDSTLFTLIKQCPLLQTVEMKHTSIGKVKVKEGDSRLSSNAKKPQIRTLILSSNEHLSNGSLRKIALACRNLETLHLRSCPNISGSGVGKFLRKCRRLKHLQIGGCLGVNDLHLHRSTHKLELLGASKSGLSDGALINISKRCAHLRFLNLKECKVFTSKGVKEVLDNCTELKEINLGRCKNVTNYILPWMVFCNPNLRKIVPPTYLHNNEESLYLRHGCYVKHE